MCTRLLTIAAWISLAACSIDASLFSEGEVVGGDDASSSGTSGSGTSGSGTQQGASSSQTSTSTSTTSTGGNTGTGGSGSGAAGTGGDPGSGGNPGTGGGVNDCSHDECVAGAPLSPLCNDCVESICNQDPYCCNQNWDYLCTYAVDDVCNKDCNPGLPTCEDQHDSTTGVDDLCGQNGEVCSLAYGGTSCSAICGAAGTECLNVYNNAPQTQCEQAQTLSCNSTPQSAICICSRGCGTGQPCTGIQLCAGGQCIN